MIGGNKSNFPCYKTGNVITHMFIVNIQKFAYNKVANLIPFNNARVGNQVKTKTTIDSISQSISKTNEILIAIYIL